MTMPTHTSTWQRARRPVLSVLLALAWLTLQQSLDLGNVLTACVLGWACRACWAAFWALRRIPSRSRVRCAWVSRCCGTSSSRTSPWRAWC